MTKLLTMHVNSIINLLVELFKNLPAYMPEQKNCLKLNLEYLNSVTFHFLNL